ncbi:MAG: hypothetical protein U9N35_02850 [Euryarchaeota archaeon]|nr:hypothetical protein [Euryarchaeota archaeon]
MQFAGNTIGVKTGRNIPKERGNLPFSKNQLINILKEIEKKNIEQYKTPYIKPREHLGRKRRFEQRIKSLEGDLEDLQGMISGNREDIKTLGNKLLTIKSEKSLASAPRSSSKPITFSGISISNKNVNINIAIFLSVLIVLVSVALSSYFFSINSPDIGTTFLYPPILGLGTMLFLFYKSSKG